MRGRRAEALLAAATPGPGLTDTGLTAETSRLAGKRHRLLLKVGEVAGLLVLLLSTKARQATRVPADGTPAPLAQRDRSFDPTESPKPYQLQAAIVTVHDERAGRLSASHRGAVTYVAPRSRLGGADFEAATKLADMRPWATISCGPPGPRAAI